jgi:hypothetical protein
MGKPRRTTSRRPTPKSSARRASQAKRSAAGRDPSLRPITGADRRRVGDVVIDVVRAGSGRIKRIIYPAGFRWSTHMKPVVGTELCMHAHVGFLARGRVRGAYADGCTFEFRSPGVVVLEPGHDAWVVGGEPAILIQFDAEKETASRFGLADQHRHAR